MAVKIGQASINEKGGINGGALGDQTGREVYTRDWYAYDWHTLFRPKSRDVAEKIAATCEAICANNNFGYGQWERATAYNLCKSAGWDCSKVKTKCNIDCSELVAVCCCAAGATVPSNLYTGNQTSLLSATGEFEILKDSKYLTTSDYVQRGDILLTDEHTIVVLSDGAKATVTTPAPTQATDKQTSTTTETVYTVKSGDTLSGIASKYGTTYQVLASYNGISNPSLIYAGQKIRIPGGKNALRPIDDIAREVIRGEWGNGADRKKRLTAAGYNYDAVQKRVNELL